MSIIVDHEIRNELMLGNLVIDPFEDRFIQPNSIDMRLSDRFSRYDNTRRAFPQVFDPYDQDSLQDGLRTDTLTMKVIEPGQFLLGATLEKITLPNYLVGQLTGKSSLARLGLMVHVTAGYIDAGFSVPPATITLELVNVGNRPIRLHAGMPIAQLVLTRTAECETPYNQKQGSKYNGQAQAQASKYYLNKQ